MRGDFIDRYDVTCEFADDNDRRSMQQNQVAVATNGQLSALARQLGATHGRAFTLHSFILLRDSSDYGKLKAQEPTDSEQDTIETMQHHHVLRLDWHDEDEHGNRIGQRIDGASYLDMAFALIH